MKIRSLNESFTTFKPASQPFFSIIIPTYNRSNLLLRALDSLVSQTETDWEAIIVDDGSTDDTLIRVLPYLRANNAMKYFKKFHSGEVLTKNTGINLSDGKFITFLDSDDEYKPAHLESRKAIISRDSSVKFLYGGVHIIGNQYVPDRFNYNKRVNLNECVIGGTFFIERNTLIQLKGFKIIYLGTDADLFDRASEAGITMKETKIPTYIYHHETEDSITNMLIKNNPEREETYHQLNQKSVRPEIRNNNSLAV